MKRFYTLHIPPQGHKASIQHQKRFWLTAIALTRRSLGDFPFPDSRSKTACRATPASAAGGGYSEQGLAQRSKKSRKSGSPKIFSGTARGVAKQLRALLPLPPKSLENTEFSRLFAFYFPLSHGGRGDAPPMAVCLPIFNRFYTLSGNITLNPMITWI